MNQPIMPSSGGPRRVVGIIRVAVVLLFSTCLIEIVNGEALNWFVPESELAKLQQNSINSGKLVGRFCVRLRDCVRLSESLCVFVG